MTKEESTAAMLFLPESAVTKASVFHLLLFGGLASLGSAKLGASENATHLVIGNDHLYAGVEKASGAMVTLELDGQNLLGTRNGSLGAFYLDCYW